MRSSLPSSGTARRAHAVIAAAVIAIVVIASPAHAATSPAKMTAAAATPATPTQSVAPQGEPQAPVCSGAGAEATSCSSGDQADGADPAAGNGTVGPPTVITDPADQVDAQPQPTADPASPPKRGELHVLGGVSRSSSPAPAAAPSPSQAQTAAVSETAVSSHAATASGTLPFTGVNAGYLALAGIALLAGGLATRRLARSY